MQLNLTVYGLVNLIELIMIHKLNRFDIYIKRIV